MRHLKIVMTIELPVGHFESARALNALEPAIEALKASVAECGYPCELTDEVTEPVAEVAKRGRKPRAVLPVEPIAEVAPEVAAETSRLSKRHAA